MGSQVREEVETLSRSSLEQPAEALGFLSPEFTIGEARREAVLRRWRLGRATAAQGAPCSPNPRCPGRALTHCMRCGYSPADRALLLDGNVFYQCYDLKQKCHPLEF